MKITNTTRGALGLSMEHVVPPGGTVDIDNDTLTDLKASPVVKAWLVDGSLVESGAVTTPVGDGLDALKARADDLGIKYGGKVGEATLRRRIEEAEAV